MVGLILLCVVLVLISIFVIVVSVTAIKTNRKNMKKLKESGFDPKFKVAGLLIDEKNGLWCKQGMTRALKLSEITDCEIIEDGISYKSDNGVLRAVIGGALFGKTGAIVGAMTSSTSEQVRKMEVRIHTADPLLNTISIPLLSTPISKASATYSSLKSTAESIVLSLDRLSGFSERKVPETSSPSLSASSTSADELAKYKKLLNY